ncbi:fimbrial protein [Enterobacter sp. SA24]
METWRWASSSPLLTASYDSNNVDTTQTRTVDGKTYYKLRMADSERFPVYVRLEQKVFLPVKNAYSYVDLKDVENQSRQHRGSFFFNTIFQNSYLSGCNNAQGNFSVTLICVRDLYYELSSQFANRDVKMYFYMPKTPLYPINFDNIFVGSVSFSRVCMVATGGDESAAFIAANNCTMNSKKAVVSRFYLNGSLIFRNTCKVTETTKNVVLADITEAKLAGKAQGALPEGYAPKETKVSMKCSGNINNSFPDGAGIVQATMMGAGYSFDADLASKGILLAKGVGTIINDLGVKITQDAAGQSLVKLDGVSPLRATINNDMATVTFYSYPTPARTGVNPTGAGGYEASATMTFEMP